MSNKIVVTTEGATEVVTTTEQLPVTVIEGPAGKPQVIATAGEPQVIATADDVDTKVVVTEADSKVFTTESSAVESQVIETTAEQGPPGRDGKDSVTLDPNPMNQIENRPEGLYVAPSLWDGKEW